MNLLFFAVFNVEKMCRTVVVDSIVGERFPKIRRRFRDVEQVKSYSSTVNFVVC